jgi:hypothetical protein
LSILDDMAKLVLRNPNVTAKELAKSLGYAEQKSVYYWLDKGGYRGMKDFREDVLRGRFPFSPGKPEPELARDHLKSVPVYTSGGLMDGRSSLSEFLKTNLGSECYGVLITSQIAGLSSGDGDLALIDPNAPHTQGDLVALKVEGTLKLARRYSLPSRANIYVDASNDRELLSPDYVAGKVVFILKRLP